MDREKAHELADEAARDAAEDAAKEAGQKAYDQRYREVYEKRLAQLLDSFQQSAASSAPLLQGFFMGKRAKNPDVATNCATARNTMACLHSWSSSIAFALPEGSGEVPSEAVGGVIWKQFSSEDMKNLS